MAKHYSYNYTRYQPVGKNWRQGVTNNAKAFGLLGLIGLFVVIVTFGVIDFSGSTLDKDNCVVGQLPNAVVAIVADLTDEVAPSPAQLRKLNQVFAHHRDTLKKGARLSVHALMSKNKHSASELRTLFSACRPSSPETANSAIEGIVPLTRRYTDDWIKPLNQAMATLVERAGRGAKTSPLMASLKELALTSALKANGARTLIVFSDLLEHSEGISHYQRTWTDLKGLQEQRLDVADIEGLFADVEVLVWQFQPSHTKHLQTTIHSAFWAQWMQSAQANYHFSRL